ncbi:hypothetical protein D3C85_1555400 [compost metagenome]
MLVVVDPLRIPSAYKYTVAPLTPVPEIELAAVVIEEVVNVGVAVVPEVPTQIIFEGNDSHCPGA